MTPFPLGQALTFEALSKNPYPIFRRLQAEEPVTWAQQLGMWLAARREDVVAILDDPETYTVRSPHSLLADTFGPMMLAEDGPEQQRLRRPFVPLFQPRALRPASAAFVERTANALIDAFAGAGEADLVKAFADPLALLAVTSALGVPVADLRRLRGWYDDFAAALGNYRRDPEVRRRGQEAAAAFGAELRALLARLRAEPDDSPLSQILRDPSQDLSDEEIVADIFVIIFGGLETTAAMFANTVWALLSHPAQLALVREAPARWVPAAVEEALRWESPVQTCTRHLTRDVVLRGAAIPAGATLQCLIGAANRDPAMFPDPDRFDITRANAAQHLAFARGRHFCLGAALARLEGEVGLRVLFERLPGLCLDSQHPSAPRGHEFRAPPALRVRWG